MAAYPDGRRASAALALLVALAGCPAEGGGGGAGGSGASGGGGSGGAPGCADLASSSPCRWEGEGNGCSVDETCAPAPGATCGDASCCTVGTSCRPRPLGAKPGGFACDDDASCASGLCVRLSGQGLCLRACDPSIGPGLCPDGQSCAVVPLDGQRSVRTCVGGEEGAFDVGRAFCATDRDCAQERYCHVEQGAALPIGEAYGLCRVGARSGLEAGRLCEGEGTGEFATFGPYATGWSAGCPESGLCHLACGGAGTELCACIAAVDDGFCRAARCTQPCSRPEDCPSPLTCKGSEFSDPDLPHPHPDLEFKYCQLPDFNGADWGCWDETDCCKGGLQRGGAPCCTIREGLCQSDAPEVTYCRVTVTGARYGSRCSLPEGLALLGAACTEGAACESGLCVDGVCTSPCDTGRADRCAEITPGTQCCGARVGEACVRACRASCEAADACTP